MNNTSRFPSLTDIGISAVRTMGRPHAGLTKEQAAAQEELRSYPDLNMTGIVLPFNAEHRAMTVTTSPEAVGRDVPEIGAGLRQTSPLDRLGGRTIFGLRGDAKLPAGKAQVFSAWKPEGTTTDETTELFDGPLLAPKRVCAHLDVSQMLLIQSPGFEAWLRLELFAVLNEEIAKVAIQGVTNGPTGLLNTTGIQTLAGDTNGSAATMADLAEMEFLVTSLRSEGSFGFLSSPKVRRKLRSAPRVAATDSAAILDDRASNRLLAYPTEFTNASPDDLTKGTGTGLSAILFGDWSEHFVGFFGPGISVEAIPVFSRNSHSKEGLVTFIASAWVDCAPRIPSVYAVRNDVITTVS